MVLCQCLEIVVETSSTLWRDRKGVIQLYAGSCWKTIVVRFISEA
jgi:hypothetical protein